MDRRDFLSGVWAGGVAWAVFGIIPKTAEASMVNPKPLIQIGWDEDTREATLSIAPAVRARYPGSKLGACYVIKLPGGWAQRDYIHVSVRCGVETLCEVLGMR